ncbi:MAG: chemotaxis response regulator protein-glutamate methylesterase [Acidimicrobiia bacterium]
MIRVLVVDDSAVIRRVVTDVLNEDPEIEVVGTAINGKVALDKVHDLQPDLITLDVEMPEMDGLAMLSALRVNYRRVPVIMFSSLTEKSAAITIEALARGASDYVTKPAGQGNLANAMASVRAELVPKVKALCSRPNMRTGGSHAPHPTPAAPLRPAPARAATPTVPTPVPAGNAAAPASARPRPQPGVVDIVAIGVSTGGPNALGQVLPRLKDLPVPVVIVQHMPPMFTKLLAEQLSNATGIEVMEGKAGMTVEARKIYIAPGDYHMVVKREGPYTKLDLNQGPPENSCRPAVDVLFRSVAQVYGNRALAVVLTGMGNDGEKGAVTLRDAGSQLIAQDQATSVVWGMPGAVARAGLADQILALGEIGTAITSKVSRRGR